MFLPISKEAEEGSGSIQNEVLAFENIVFFSLSPGFIAYTHINA